MAQITIKVTDEEKHLMEYYARMAGTNLSSIVKVAFFEKLENEKKMQKTDK